MKRVGFVFILLLIITVIIPFARFGHTQTVMTVFASIMPQAYFLERIGGQFVNVEVLVGEGQSPHTYEPSPQQMAKLSSAKAYFAIGVPFEKNVISKIKKINRKLTIIETQKGISYRYLENHHHKANKSHDIRHDNRIPDPHIWMDPKLVKVQAQNIHDALCKLDPEHTNDYSKNLQTFLTDLRRVDQRIAHVLAPFKDNSIYVFHPAFGYFTDSYGLHQVSIEIEGKEPSAKQLTNTIDKAKKGGVHIIFVQPQFSKKSAKTIAMTIGGVVVPIDPLSKDYLSNLEKIASEIEKGLARR